MIFVVLLKYRGVFDVVLVAVVVIIIIVIVLVAQPVFDCLRFLIAKDYCGSAELSSRLA